MKKIVLPIMLFLISTMYLNGMYNNSKAIGFIINMANNVNQGMKIKNFEIIFDYMDRNLVIDEQDEWGDTPLHKAIEEKKVSEIKQLLSRGAPCNIPNELGQTAISLLIKQYNDGNQEISQCFQEYGCIIVHNHCDVKQLLNDNAKGLEQLLEEHIIRNSSIESAKTAQRILQAAEQCKDSYKEGYVVSVGTINCFVMMRLIDIQKHFNIVEMDYVRNIVNAYCAARTIVTKCQENQYPEAEQLLLQHPLIGEDVRFNRYIMSRLLQHEQRECWQMLLKFNFKPTITYQPYGTILHGLARYTNIPALSILIIAGADVQRPNEAKKTPIQILYDAFKKAYKLEDRQSGDKILSALNTVRVSLLERNEAEENRKDQNKLLAESLFTFIRKHTLKYG